MHLHHVHRERTIVHFLDLEPTVMSPTVVDLQTQPDGTVSLLVRYGKRTLTALRFHPRGTYEDMALDLLSEAQEPHQTETMPNFAAASDRES